MAGALVAGTVSANTMTVTTITDGTNTATTTAIVNGICKAWVNFNGSGSVGNQTIRSSYNVSSVYKNSSGNYTINFTNALTDTNYAVVGSTAFSGQTAGASSVGVFSEYTNPTSTYGTKTTSAVQIVSCDNNSDQFLDGYSINCAIYR